MLFIKFAINLFMNFFLASVMIICGVAEGRLRNHLDRPGYLKRMRTLCTLCLLAWIWAIYLLVSGTWGVAAQYAQTRTVETWDAVFLAVLWPLGIFSTVYFCQLGAYYLLNDAAAILAAWYYDRHVESLKEDDIELAHKYLLKASEANPDAVWVWGNLARFSLYALDAPHLADLYMARARAALASNRRIRPKDRAQFEYYTGWLHVDRNNPAAALPHLERALEQAPSRFLRKQYKKALAAAQPAQTNPPAPA